MDKGSLSMDAMYRVRTELTMPDGSVMIVRTLSEAEVQTKNRMALDASRRRADDLRDPQSAAHKELIAPLRGLSVSAARTILSSLKQTALRRDAVGEIPYEFIPIPDGASLEEKQEVLARREKSEEKTRERREQWVASRLKEYQAKIEKLEHDAVLRELEAQTILAYAYQSYFDTLQYATLYLACRHEDGRRWFSSLEQVSEMGSAVLDRVFAAYREVDGVDPWELEKNALTDSSTGPAKP